MCIAHRRVVKRYVSLSNFFPIILYYTLLTTLISRYSLFTHARASTTPAASIHVYTTTSGSPFQISPAPPPWRLRDSVNLLPLSRNLNLNTSRRVFISPQPMITVPLFTKERHRRTSDPFSFTLIVVERSCGHLRYSRDEQTVPRQPLVRFPL